jgi:hypothetical protein
MTVPPPKRVKPLYSYGIFSAIRRAIRDCDRRGLGAKPPIAAPKQRHGGETLPSRWRESHPSLRGVDSLALGAAVMAPGHTKGRRFHDAL